MGGGGGGRWFSCSPALEDLIKYHVEKMGKENIEIEKRKFIVISSMVSSGEKNIKTLLVTKMMIMKLNYYA